MKKLLFSTLFITLFLLMQFFSFGNSFVIGTPGSRGELLIPSQVEEGPDGNVYVYDRKDLMIKVYNSSGKFLYKMGGRGEGPGEFKRFGRFGFTENGKELFATEYFSGHNWVTFFSIKGKFLKTLKLPFKGFYGVLNAIDTGSDTFILRVTYSAKIYKKGKIYYYGNRDLLYRINSKTMKYDEIKKSTRDTRISNISSGGDIGIPFIPGFDWDITREGKILFSDRSSNIFEMVEPKTGGSKKIKIDIPGPEPVKDSDLSAWRKEVKDFFTDRDPGWYKTFGNVAEKYRNSIYKKKPCHNGFQILPSSNILIRKNMDESGSERIWYLVSQAGKLIKSVKTTGIDFKISSGYIFVFEKDEDDENILRVFKRIGSDVKDLGMASRN